MTTTSGYASHAGLDTYYEIHGGPLAPSQTPFVLLHGGLMTIEVGFAGRLLPQLAALAPVIAVELQCHGHTGDREGPVRLDDLADDVAAVLDHLGVVRAHLAGFSLGAMVAFGTAVRHPSKVASLTALGASYTFDGMQHELVKLQRDPGHVPSDALIPLLPTEADFAAWRAGFEAAAPDPSAFDRSVERINAMVSSWPGWDASDVARIASPVLLAIGDNDFVRIDHAAETVALMPNARLAVLPGTTHTGLLDRGAWLVPMIAEQIA
jgi:pimeloyl-ACP methyl ester carboxylesterase